MKIINYYYYVLKYYLQGQELKDAKYFAKVLVYGWWK